MAHTYRILRRPWRARRPLYWGMLPELAGIVPLLVLFGVQQPDAFRSLFWRIGFEHKLNSNPNMILYAYANHQPLPTIVWSQTVYGQAGPDYADSRYPSPVAWYIRYGCDLARALWRLCLRCLAMVPNKQLDMDDSDDEDEYGHGPKGKGAAVEMQPTPPV
ncbi:hypothetical protein NEMBOFW57_003452 [Staphylotrichum longicolle]|uniref:Uncharacterized protein n=1 Tax=Staphylotrichum longicolle TaxID=669026 RepID=A0AAD4I2P6_9PEZI|nr:hypothetical protein NEMBOFW57_003452 [Staphylotrichum longicolle]